MISGKEDKILGSPLVVGGKEACVVRGQRDTRGRWGRKGLAAHGIWDCAPRFVNPVRVPSSSPIERECHKKGGRHAELGTLPPSTLPFLRVSDYEDSPSQASRPCDTVSRDFFLSFPLYLLGLRRRLSHSPLSPSPRPHLSPPGDYGNLRAPTNPRRREPMNLDPSDTGGTLRNNGSLYNRNNNGGWELGRSSSPSPIQEEISYFFV